MYCLRHVCFGVQSKRTGTRSCLGPPIATYASRRREGPAAQSWDDDAQGQASATTVTGVHSIPHHALKAMQLDPVMLHACDRCTEAALTATLLIGQPAA